jgi:hypothetical protein
VTASPTAISTVLRQSQPHCAIGKIEGIDELAFIEAERCNGQGGFNSIGVVELL